MTLVRWTGRRQDNVDDMGLCSPSRWPRGEMDRLFDRFFRNAWGIAPAGAGAANGWNPSLDVSETDTEITVRAEIPGIDAEDLELTVTGRVLAIAGEKKEATEEKGENFFHSESSFGSFRRCLQLPAPVDTKKVAAEHKNGVLMIRLTKQQSAQPQRIPVQACTS